LKIKCDYSTIKNSKPVRKNYSSIKILASTIQIPVMDFS
jgi:hypothetical protein